MRRHVAAFVITGSVVGAFVLAIEFPAVVIAAALAVLFVMVVGLIYAVVLEAGS